MHQDRAIKFDYKTIIIEIIAITSFALAWGHFSNRYALFSAICGGMCWLLPSAYFLYRKTIILVPQNAKNMAQHFFAAEAIKLVLSAILVILCVKFFTKIMMPPFLNGYIIAVFIGLISFNRKSKP